MGVGAFGVQHHAASNDNAAMRWRSVPPGHECDGPILLMALDPAFGVIKASGNVCLWDAAEVKAKHLAEVQHHQTVTVASLPVTAPAYPWNANGASNEFGLCESSWHPSDARELWLDQLQARECCRIINHPDLTPHRVVVRCHYLHSIRRELHPASLGSVETPYHLRRCRVT